MGRAGPFGTDHAGTDRIFRRAHVAEQLALDGTFQSAQDRCTFAAFVIIYRLIRTAETLLGIEPGERRAQPQG